MCDPAVFAQTAWINPAVKVFRENGKYELPKINSMFHLFPAYHESLQMQKHLIL